MWVRFGWRSRLVDTWRGQEEELEGTAKGVMAIQVDVEVYLVADGRSIGWKEAEGLGGEKIPWNSGKGTSDEWTGSEEERKTEDQEKAIEGR